LFAATLAGLFLLGWRQSWAAAVALVMLCLPQVIYIYGYANSDAWGLTCALALMTYGLGVQRPLTSWRRALLLGGLCALVMLSKLTMWVAIPFALTAATWRLWRERALNWPAAGRAALGAALAGLMLAPTLVIYPLSQGGTPALTPELGLRTQMRQV